MNGLTLICCACAGLAALLMLLNWVGLVAFIAARPREPGRGGYSFALPFICGPALAASWALGPGLPFRHYAWVALLFDPSILFVLLALVNSRRS